MLFLVIFKWTVYYLLKWIHFLNKEASWFYAELKLHISFQVSLVAYLKLSDEI